MWAASRVGADGQWEPLTAVSSGEYRHQTGTRPFLKWSERSLRRPEMQAAAEGLSGASLKTPDPVTFTAALVRQAAAWHVLRTFYGSKAFGKRRFLRMRRKQAFEEEAVNRLIAESERGARSPFSLREKFPLKKESKSSRMGTGNSRPPCVGVFFLRKKICFEKAN